MKSSNWTLGLLAALLLTACQPAASAPPSQTPEQTSTPTPEPTPTQVTATLAVAGDVMSHMPQTNDAYDGATGEYDYRPMLRHAKEQVSRADYAVANLETTFSGGPHYSGYPAFNTPDALADALANAGFDLLSTANNHSLDKRFEGLSRTLDVLDQRGLAHVGTYRTREEREADHGIVVADVGGIRVAFLAYTYGTNAIPVSEGKEFSINIYNKDYLTNLSEPDYDLLRADMAAARALESDLIAVIIHWGVEYQTKQNTWQESMNAFLREEGADLVLGGHAHVLQPYVWEGGDFTCYSMGNFISSQKDRYTDTTVVYELELTKDLLTGETTVTDVRYTPYLMLDRGKQAQERFVLLDCHAVEREEEQTPGSWSAAVLDKVRTAIEDCHQILGPEGDRDESAEG